MCTQVDKQWACGHTGFFMIKFCDNLFKGCKGTSATHEIVTDKDRCGDCHRRDSLPEPLESK
ncbi:hypothetical protein NLU13_7700 [Sarocladium strictum]|uniref:Uncharacterized protein n=1 Tax=Sarocladium strictum TaxID=5046 RepID=A0AA39GDA0_SARSR|nr:hypothetical protein NLU13_7700 [Sarocladium strictum]